MDLADTKVAVRRLNQRLYVQAKRRHDTTKLSHWCLQTAMCIAIHFNYDFTHAVLWLQSKQRRGASLDADGDEATLLSDLEEFFLSCNVDVLATWTDPESSPLLSSSLKTAAAFVKKQQLANWVREQNMARGVSVNTNRLISHFNESLSEASCSGLVPEARELHNINGRQWASRWRRRFGSRYGFLRVEEPVSLEEKRGKAWRQIWWALGPCFGAGVKPI